MLSPELSTAMLLIILAGQVICFIAAYGSFHFCMKVSRERRDYRELLLFVQQLDDQHEALSASHKRLRSRVGMQDLRARKKSAQNGAQDPEEAEPVTDAEKWKRDMRIKLARGDIKPR